MTAELGRPPEAAGLPKLGPSLITGAAGFIGRALALALRFEGLEVRGLVRPQHDAGDLEAAGVHVVRGDATDADALADAAAGCQVIFHLAAARGTHKLGHRAYQDLNRRMTEAVSRAALSVGVRRVVLSSSASLSGYPGPHRQTEDTPVRPNSGYRASRLLSEEILDQFQRTEGLNFVVARLSQAISGPGAYAWTKVVRSVREGRYRVLPKGGSIHSGDVEDIVDGLRRCAVAPGICGERFLLGAPEPMPTVTVLQTIARHLDVPFAPTILPAAPFLAYVALGNRVYRALRISLPHHFTAEFYSARVALDIDRARRRLGYSPRFDMSTSIERTVAWLRESSRV